MYFQKVNHLFGRTRALEAQTDEFFDNVVEGGIAFRQAVRSYLDDGPSQTFMDYVEQAKAIEHRDLSQGVEPADEAIFATKGVELTDHADHHVLG